MPKNIVFAYGLSFVETLETLFFADGIFFLKSFVTLSLQTGLLLRMLSSCGSFDELSCLQWTQLVLCTTVGRWNRGRGGEERQ